MLPHIVDDVLLCPHCDFGCPHSAAMFFQRPPCLACAILARWHSDSPYPDAPKAA